MRKKILATLTLSSRSIEWSLWEKNKTDYRKLDFFSKEAPAPPNEREVQAAPDHFFKNLSEKEKEALRKAPTYLFLRRELFFLWDSKNGPLDPLIFDAFTWRTLEERNGAKILWMGLKTLFLQQIEKNAQLSQVDVRGIFPRFLAGGLWGQKRPFEKFGFIERTPTGFEFSYWDKGFPLIGLKASDENELLNFWGKFHKDKPPKRESIQEKLIIFNGTSLSKGALETLSQNAQIQIYRQASLSFSTVIPALKKYNFQRLRPEKKWPVLTEKKVAMVSLALLFISFLAQAGTNMFKKKAEHIQWRTAQALFSENKALPQGGDPMDTLSIIHQAIKTLKGPFQLTKLTIDRSAQKISLEGMTEKEGTLLSSFESEFPRDNFNLSEASAWKGTYGQRPVTFFRFDFSHES